MRTVKGRHVVLLPLVTDTGIVEVTIGKTGRANVHTLGEACTASQGCEDVIPDRLGL